MLANSTSLRMLIAVGLIGYWIPTLGAIASDGSAHGDSYATARSESTFVLPPGRNPAANCKRLRKAIADNSAATATAPVTIQLTSAIFSCGATPLVLNRFITIQGAGRSLTRILGNVNSSSEGIVVGANGSALRSLTVEHRGTANGGAVGVSVASAKMRLSDVAVRVGSESASQVFGVVANGGILEMAEVTIESRSDNSQSQGILGISTRMDLRNVWVHNLSGNVGNPAALESRDGAVRGFGLTLSSPIFGLVGRGTAAFTIVGGTILGGRGVGADFTGSFTCVAVAKENFATRRADCT